MNVQIFGLKNSQASRAAERFFKERRIQVQYVDLKQRPMSPGELKRFTDRFGLQSLLDTTAKAYEDAGLRYLKLTEADLLRRIEADGRLLKLPLVRLANKLSVGHDEEAWKAMAAEAAAAAR
ncbi:MAG: ArsC/Spx/MgsR family protein [Bryobacteraceae bacterium]|nr:ArsC/Spx/MgsR family protein [Bryobacteraceae bacterium]